MDLLGQLFFFFSSGENVHLEINMLKDSLKIGEQQLVTRTFYFKFLLLSDPYLFWFLDEV